MSASDRLRPQPPPKTAVLTRKPVLMAPSPPQATQALERSSSLRSDTSRTNILHLPPVECRHLSRSTGVITYTLMPPQHLLMASLASKCIANVGRSLFLRPVTHRFSVL